MVAPVITIPKTWTLANYPIKGDLSMKILKIITVFVLSFMVCIPVSGGDRKAKKSMKELTDKNSPSYVPHPYPKTRTEIIGNIKYYYIDLHVNLKSSYVGGTPIYKEITFELFNSDSRYKFGKIVKVKNRSEKFANDYSWLIYVLDEEGDAVMRIAQKASGLVIGSSISDKKSLSRLSATHQLAQRRLYKVLEENDVKQYLYDALGETEINNKIKKIERLGCNCSLAEYDTPLWEIVMKNGTTYYYSEVRDVVYSVEKKNPWKKGKYGRRWIKHRQLSNKNYIPDSINDQLIFLTPMPNNN
jgi:hypothetical protein